MALQERIKFAKNPEPRCPVILLLDNSFSMSGEPIQELNQGVVVFKENILKDETAALRVEIAIISFGDKPTLVQNFITVDEFPPPQLTATGRTPMGKAIELALDHLEERKLTYRNNGIAYYQPWVLLITDGEPTDEYKNAAQKVRKAAGDRKLSFYAIAVKNANIKKLREIAPLDTPPLPLDGLKFKELFKWLSDSVKQTSRQKIGEQIELADFSGWMRKQA